MTRNIPGILALALALALAACGSGQPAMPESRPADTPVPTASIISVDIPSAPTSTPNSTATPMLTPIPIVEWVRPADGMTMVFVSQGDFIMGEDAEAAFSVCSWTYNNCQVIMESFKTEGPKHTVWLDAYWIDKTDVTSGMYTKCLQAGACKPIIFFGTPVPGVDDPANANYPVTLVDWDQASAYCAWAGARLPSEAEWEKAARGPDGRIFPWGNLPPTGTQMNTGSIKNQTEVGQYPDGASPYGALDMAGEVEQWVADYYSDTYYAESPPANPQGPEQGQMRVYRGSMWNAVPMDMVVYARQGVSPWDTNAYRGFRCARSQE